MCSMGCNTKGYCYYRSRQIMSQENFYDWIRPRIRKLISDTNVGFDRYVCLWDDYLKGRVTTDNYCVYQMERLHYKNIFTNEYKRFLDNAEYVFDYSFFEEFEVLDYQCSDEELIRRQYSKTNYRAGNQRKSLFAGGIPSDLRSGCRCHGISSQPAAKTPPGRRGRPAGLRRP